MQKEWFTNAELAALNLPGFPATEPGVSAWFKKRDLDARFPNKVRRRIGRGGGLERHFTILPRHIQSLLTIKLLKSADTPPMEEIFAGAHAIPEPPCNQAGELRRDAILLLLNFWDIYRTKTPLAQETARHFFVEMFRNRKIEGVPEWVYKALKSETGRLKGVCINTLSNWEKKRDDHQFTGLAGNYGNRKGTGLLDTAAAGRVAGKIAALIVAQPHLTADHIRDLIRADFPGFAAPSIRTFERWIAAWKADHHEALMKMTNPDGFKNRKRFAGSNMNHWVARPNQLWEIDASPADVMLNDGRYSIYACIDIWTRRMIVSVSKTATTEAVLALVRKAIAQWGVPEIIRTDNGSDFTSYRFKGALSHLGIHQDITDLFSPEQKGTVERAIGTLQRGLMPLLPGFIGHNVTDRARIEARRSFAQRLGCSDEKAFCVDLDHDELQSRISQWLAVKYEHSVHSRIDMSPFEKAASWTGPLRRIEDERALDILLAPLAGKDGFRVVTKQGIRVDKASFIHPDLVPGERVFCRQDPDDMGRLYVYNIDAATFLCIATCPERLGADPGTAIREVRAAQARRIADELEPIRRDIRAMKPRDMIDKVLRVNEAATASVASFPKASELYTSPALEAAADALRPAPEPSALSAEEEAAADDAWSAMEGGNVTRLPVPVREPEPPTLRFETDADFVLWVRANPEEASHGQTVYADELYRTNTSIRMLVEDEESRRAANATA